MKLLINSVTDLAVENSSATQSLFEGSISVVVRLTRSFTTVVLS